MWTLAAVIAGAVVLSFFGKQPRPVGDELRAAMETKQPRLRGALILVGAVPGELEATGPETFQRGGGALPGIGVAAPAADQRWVRWKGGEFSWRTSAKPPLREAIAVGSESRKGMARALSVAGYYGDVAELAMRTAKSDLDKMGDEEMFLAWLGADSGTLEQCETLARATREGLLLVARQNPGPVVSFASGKENLYLLPADNGESGASTWVTMEAYEGGKLRWIGV